MSIIDQLCIRIQSVMKLRCPKQEIKEKKGRNGSVTREVKHLPWAIADFRETDHAYDFAFIVPSGYSALDLQQETDAIYAACGAPISIIDRGGRVIVSVRKVDFPEEIPYDPSLLELTKGKEVLCGFDAAGKPVTHHFRVPHMMIAGMSGYGKTDFLRWLVFQLISRFTPDQLEIHIIDMKGFSFIPFRGVPQITRVARTINQAKAILKDGYDEMNRRSDIVWETGDRKAAAGFKWRLILVDEASQISPVLKEQAEEKAIAALCWQYACAISCIGREAGVGLIYATQYPTVEVIRGQIKANMDAVLCFKTENDTHSTVTLNSPIAAALPHGKAGRAIMKAGGFTEIQTPYIGKDDAWDELLAPYRKEVKPDDRNEEIDDLDGLV